MTQLEIAKRLGVSQAAVSYALRGGRKTSPDLRRKVLELAGLAEPEPPSKILGVIVNQRAFKSSSLPRALEGIQRRAGELGLRATHYIGDGSSSLAAEAKDVLGFIRMDEKTPLEGLRGQVPCVLLGACDDRDGLFDAVSMDNAAGVWKAAERLRSLGHERIGYFCLGDLPSFHSLERHSAYLQALEEFGLQAPRDEMMRSSRLLAASKLDDDAMTELFVAKWRSTPASERPSAFICFNDFFALTLLRKLKAAGIAVPGDLSLTGFDDTEDGRASSPPLDSVDPHDQLMGAIAVDLLLARAKGDSTPYARRLRVCPSFIPRASSASPGSS